MFCTYTGPKSSSHEAHDQLARRFEVLLPRLNERQRRLALPHGLAGGGADYGGCVCAGNNPAFPDPADKRGAELLYRVGDLKRWARNRPRAAIGTTDLS
ncbi:hypothetical protein FCI23_54300 [Actinacidiphila oryziradicis]|uniref:Uncharacterized protein n=1 Tax=Actinacidiphila oryziradicis TaxID=2571141 RepID=A0A4U0RDZ3_9ACTN|nr:hypothetical protein FCI23_54300 [Actinacidiphila oryziradicis]